MNNDGWYDIKLNETNKYAQSAGLLILSIESLQRAKPTPLTKSVLNMTLNHQQVKLK